MTLLVVLLILAVELEVFEATKQPRKSKHPAHPNNSHPKHPSHKVKPHHGSPTHKTSVHKPPAHHQASAQHASPQKEEKKHASASVGKVNGLTNGQSDTHHPPSASSSTSNKSPPHHKSAKKHSNKKKKTSTHGLKLHKTKHESQKSCKNQADNCHQLFGFCQDHAYVNVLKKFCSAKCGHCEPKGSDCKDEYDKCHEWLKQGFCQSKYYSLQMRRSMCAKSCLLCSIGTVCAEAHNKFVDKCLHLKCADKKHRDDEKCMNFCLKNQKICGAKETEDPINTTAFPPQSVTTITIEEGSSLAPGQTPGNAPGGVAQPATPSGDGDDEEESGSEEGEEEDDGGDGECFDKWKIGRFV